MNVLMIEEQKEKLNYRRRNSGYRSIEGDDVDDDVIRWYGIIDEMLDEQKA